MIASCSVGGGTPRLYPMSISLQPNHNSHSAKHQVNIDCV